MKWVENLFNLDDQHYKYLFWFFSLLTIPIFAYLYTLPMTLLIWLMAKLFGLSDKNIDMSTKLGLSLCFLAAFATQFHLWKMYKKNSALINKEDT